VPCNGQTLPINQNQALFSLIGTTYGGDGTQTFALPNLQGRLPISAGGDVHVGQIGGELTHALSTDEMPYHVHEAQASTVAAKTGGPGPSVTLAQSVEAPLYSQLLPFTAMSPEAMSQAGGSQPHENMMPYLVLSFCICVGGDFPRQQ
jgi:microcystin-dependent protein